jgi:hypothetical protein
MRTLSFALTVALLALLPAACSDDRSSTGAPAPGAASDDPLRSPDPAVAGPAIYARWRAGVETKDADGLWRLLSRRTRDFLLKGAKKEQARALADPETATRMKEGLGLSQDPGTMDPETLAKAMTRRSLESPKVREEFEGEFGESFVRAERHGEGLVVVGRISGEKAAKRPKGEGRTYFVREDGAWVFDVEAQAAFAGGTLRTLPVPGEGVPQAVALSGDGSTVIVVTSGETWLLPWSGTAAPVKVASRGAYRVVSDPRGAWFALDNPNSEEGLTVWSLPKGEKLRVLAADRPDAIAFAPDGRTLLAVFPESMSGGPYQGPWLFPIPEGEPKALPLPKEVRVGSAAFLPDGGAVLLEEFDGDLRVHALDGARRRTIPRTKASGARGVAVHPKEPWAVACDEEGKAFLYGLDTGEEIRRIGADDGLREPQFSPDGSQVALENGSWVARYDVATGQVRGQHRGPHFLECFAWHPKENVIVGAGRDDDEKPHVYVFSAAD